MFERVLENWLDKANERSFQVPFCHALAAAGHTIIHMSRHCAMEMGKDIITIDPSGIVCAYQLKGVDGGKMTLTQYREELEPQLLSLATSLIVHPSLPNGSTHKPYIVINGELNEEVQRSLDDFNRMLQLRGFGEQQISVVVKGQMLDMFKSLGTDFWPTKLTDAKTLLEMFLDDGLGPIPKNKLCLLLCSVLPFETKNNKMPGQAECSRSLAACAVLCSLAISAFVEQNNYASEFEAWTIYFAHILALADKWNLPPHCWAAEVEMASQAMVIALSRLAEELMGRKHLLQGNAYSDKGMLGARTTHLLALMSMYGMYLQRADVTPIGLSDDDKIQHIAFARQFCTDHEDEYHIWGEAAVAQLTIYYLYRRKIDATMAAHRPLRAVIEQILRSNRSGSDHPLASPYYQADEVLPHVLLPDTKPISDHFINSSYTLESLLHLYVRLNFKQDVKLIWHRITKFVFLSFSPEPSWHFYVWRSENGFNNAVIPPMTKNWPALCREAEEHEGASLPPSMRQYPWHFLAILSVMPHRWSSDGVRWVASQL